MSHPDAILGLDVGAQRVGISLKARGLSLVVPIGAVPRKAAEAEVLRLVTEKMVHTILIGLPLLRDGKESKQCLDVRRFARGLRRKCGVRIVLFDEYLTSREADGRLSSSTRTARDVRESGIRDAVAATVLVEEYLSRLATSHNEPVGIEFVDNEEHGG